MNYTLQAATNADFAFLYDLHVKAMRAAIEKTWGWDEDFQMAYFRQHFTTDNTDIFMVGNVPVGKLICERDPQRILLAEIEILPEYQRKGLGTAIIQALIDEAKASHKEVVLQVLKTNSDARRLYERLGFELYGETETHKLMRVAF
ncbi:MAG TPA: GNAT family N-acetyltransferase [Aggregatilineales bacterium]|nr:GNAT family N-acetyltransferase [Aggregatilineales bacterium]